jgi:O-acetylhomoserine (thiol)-lyase
MKTKGFATRAIHGAAGKRDVYGSLRMPVYDTVAFEHESAASIAQTFAGRKQAHVYSRISNPTVQDFEQRLKLLSGGLAVLALSSGMAAISNTVMTLAGAGANIVTTRSLFGNTFSLFEKTFKPWGLAVRYVSMDNPDEIDQAIDHDTCAVYLESVTNPQLEVADCARISAVTRQHRVPLVVDNTLMTPYLFETKKAGIDIELLSTTKYISGGATSVGGAIIDNGTFNWEWLPKLAPAAAKTGAMAFMASLRQEVYRNTGACLSPHNAYLQSLGLETMSLRIDKSCDNALRLARFLESHPKVRAVNYPGLAGAASHPIAKKQFGEKFGGLLTVDLASQEACYGLMDALQLIRLATNLNDNKSLILHPWSTIYAEYSPEDRLAMGVRPTMLRLSAGIEDHADLIEDLEKGLNSHD